jgi:hypothetical protein
MPLDPSLSPSNILIYPLSVYGLGFALFSSIIKVILGFIVFSIAI